MPFALSLVRNDLPMVRQKITGQMQRDILRIAAAEFRQVTWENFGVTGVGRPRIWPPLSEYYKKELRKKSFGTPLIPTLLRTGTLMNSIRLIVNSDSSTVFTANPYAADHQFGVPWRRLPARPYFPIKNITLGGNFQLTNYAEGRIMGKLQLEANRLIG